MQIFAQVVSIAIAVVGIALFVRAISRIVGVLKVGQPARRTDHPGARLVTLVKESLGHTRMLQWTWMGAGHWFIFIGFGLLFFTLVTAFGQLFHADYALPLIGHWFLFEWVAEFFTVAMLIAIVAFIGYRATRPKERTRGAKGRFYGSTMWQAYFVEFVILLVGLCIAVLRGAEYAYAQVTGEHVAGWHYPFSIVLGKAMDGMSAGSLANLIYLTAMVKILVSFTWMITISLQPTMGVAWHRFLAFFNIYFKRHADGRTSLGGLAPMTADGKPINFEDLEDMDEDTVLGVGKVEDFAWKGILDFTTCTECGRCQSQCPAWNTDKPLSPKLLVLGLRDHAHAKAPYLQAESEEARAELPAAVLAEAERPLVGETEGEWAWMPEGGAVIDNDVLWSCTSCGACVQQCPVDIEHVDHIVDMRRYQVLVESNFPTELNGLFKGLENKGNPWNMAPNARMEWAQGLDFDVKVVGEDVESLDEVDWLFWVGCAGAYEDRAKKTTRAVAELLDLAGVSFAVLGNGETCTGDPARRAGNEFVFQGLATQNAETFKEKKVKKVVSTCAHCFNTLKNEYAEFGVELEVVHHTQLLNRLVREKKLTPVAANAGAGTRSITYHDPCYLGRHNQVYSPPRELLNVIPDAELKEMPRNSERSFCCGAGGARMWMEENIGERINVNRTKEAVETGADQIAVGCPFCRVMLSDGLTQQQSKGEAREEVEVLDVAQLLLASVKGEPTSAPKKAKAAAKKAAAPAAAAAADATAADDEAVKAEPEAGDATQTEDTVTKTEEVGAAAQASGGSLFDVGGDDAPAESEAKTDPEPEEPAAEKAAETEQSEEPAAAAAAAPQAESDDSFGGSLFDLGGDAAPAETPEAPADAPADAPAEPAADAAPEETPEPEPEPEPAPEPAASGDGFASGSLFDIAADPEPTPAESQAESQAESPAEESAAEEEPAAEEPAAESTTDEQAAEPAAAKTGTTPSNSIPEGGSLFDIEAPEEPAATAPAEPEPEPEPEAAADAADQAEDESEPATDTEAEAEPEPAAEDKAAEDKAAEDMAAEDKAAEPAKVVEQADEPRTDASEQDASASGSAEEAPASLFDIKAAAAGSSKDAAPAKEPAETPAESSTESADATAEETPDETSDETPEEAPESQDGKADEPADEATAEPSAADTAEESPEPPTAQQMPASDEAHQPKTDSSIEEAGSLFDL